MLIKVTTLKEMLLRQTIDNSLLQTFRLFVILRIVVIIIGTFRFSPLFGTNLWWINATSVALSLVLLLYLYSEPLQRHLPRFYLPIALTTLTLMIVLEGRITQTFLLRGTFLNQIPSEIGSQIRPLLDSTAFPLLISLGSSTSLFVPLVFISWQYNLRSVLGFIGLTTLMEIGLIVLLRDIHAIESSLEIFGIINRASAFLIVGYIVTQLVTSQRRDQSALQASNRELALYATTREKLLISQERNRMARELHDTIAHTMSGVTVKLNATHLLWERDPERARNMLGEVIASMNDGMTETRRALRDLRATPLDDMGLVLAVRHLAESAAQRGGFALELDTPNKELRFAPDIELAIYRIVQEALTNAVEHANAKCVQVSLRQTGQFFTLKIADDGVGFDPTTAQDNGHFGLQGLQERAQMLGGLFKLESTLEKGTSIELRLELIHDSRPHM